MLYLLTRKDKVYYDHVAGFVVRADSESRARELAAGAHALEGPDCWYSPERVACRPLGYEGEEGIILGSFRAG